MPNRSLSAVPVHHRRPQSILRQPLLPPCPTYQWRRKAALLLALGSLLSQTEAAPITIDLSGNTAFDGWAALNGTALPGVMFPGTAAWPTTGGNWTSDNTGDTVVGAINSEVAGSGDSVIYRISSGLGGGPYPAGSSIYFGGTSGTPNTEGGTLGIVDPTPLSSLKTVVLQVDIGEATGYDFYNRVLPTLTYTTASGSVTMGAATFSGKIGQIYNGSVPMPTGIEDIYINTWGLQWDLSSVTEPILSVSAQFTGVQHAQLYGVQLNQSDAIHALTALPRPSVWTAAGANPNWSTTANWDGNTVPAAGKDLTFSSGSGVNVDSNRSAGAVNLAADGNFSITATNGAKLTLSSGITTTPDAPANIQVSAPVEFSQFNILNLNENTDLTVSGGITGKNFYKQGAGTLRLTGNNTYTGTSSFGVIFGGGQTFISGTNTYQDAGVLDVWIKKDGVVTLQGGNNRLGSNFAVRFDGGNRLFVEGTGNIDVPGGTLVLGDASAPSNQTLAGLSTVTMTTTETTRNYVVGGNATPSVLTIQSDSENNFTGKIGGNGQHENQIALVKNGNGMLALTNTNTFTGGFTINAGSVQVTQDSALGAGPVTVNGGSIKYGAAFDDLRAFTVTSSSLTLDTNGFNVSYGRDLTGATRLNKVGIGVLTLSGNNTHTGGINATGGFVAVNEDAALGAVPATATPGNLALNGGGLFATESFTLDSRRGIALGVDGASYLGYVQVADGKKLTYGGALANAGVGNSSLFKLGTGTLHLTGQNTYTGTTDVYQGKIQLDFANAASSTNLIQSASALRLYGGDLEIVARSSGSTTQGFSSFAANSGHSNLKADSNGGAGLNMSLGALSRTAGATANIDLPASGTVTTTSTALTNGVVTSVASTGLAYVTANQSDWLTISGGALQPLTAYETSANPGDWTATKNVSLSTNATGVNGQTVNTLKLHNGADVAMSGGILTLGTGGLLVTGSSGASEISGGTLRGSGGTTKELVVFQNNTAGTLSISSVIANNSTATAFTKTGDGVLALSGASTYTGVTRILGGTLEFNSLTAGGVASSIGQAPASATNLVIDGGTLKYTGPAATSNRGFTLGYQGGTVDASGSGAISLTATTPVGYTGGFSRTLTLTGTNTGDNVLQIPVHNSTSGQTSIVKDGPGTWVLSPGSNSFGNNQFTGGLTINSGTIKLGRTGALNSLGGNTVAFGSGADPKLGLNGYSTLISGLSSVNSNPFVENGAATPAILTISGANSSVFSGVLRDGSTGTLGLTKAGTGELTLAGLNLYNGPTEISGGILEIAATGALAGNGDINVHEGGELVVLGNIGGTGALNLLGGKLKGTGVIARGLTIGAGGVLAPGNSPGTLATGSLTWGAEGSLEFELAQANGSSGSDWDFVHVNGSLNITASEANPFILDLISLNATYEAGPLTDFDPNQNFSWVFATASGGITGFEPGNITVDTTHFANQAGGTFNVSQAGDNLVLNYAVPEPGAATLLLCAAASLLIKRRRQSRP